MFWSLFLKNWPKWLSILIFLIIILSLQIALFGPEARLPFQFNLIMVILIFLVLLANLKTVLAFTVLSGTVLDIYSGLPFGIFLFCFFLVFLVLYFLFTNFFTNRSFYTLISLGLIGILSYHIFFFLISGFLYLAGGSNFSFSGSYWLLVLSQTVSTSTLISLMFWIINRSSKRFKPIFLRS
ncbi:MAG: hypothetical protein AAB791_00730 [Patescibacteria group bacterium]